MKDDKFTELIENSRLETEENRSKSFFNITATVNESKPYDNKHFLNLVSYMLNIIKNG